MTVSLAKEIVQTLVKNGFTAYFAGGWVRDHLLGISSPEIDIATNAPPEKIQALFPKTVAVGISFGVIVVVFKGINFEVTTFRKDHPYLDGRHPTGVDFSTAQKDALRRDFTINGMFYDPLTEEIHDYVGGQEDLKKGVIRAIGDPEKRFQEDRLRMIRAVRFSARFGFPIIEETSQAIKRQASTLFPSVSVERIWQELTKMSHYPYFDRALLQLHALDLFQTFFPPISYERLKEQVACFPCFPLHTPLIVYILQLFPQQGVDLAKFFKTTTSDIRLAEFFLHSPRDKREWVYFYAHPSSPLYLAVEEAKLSPVSREKFHMEHEQKRKELALHIERVAEKKPLVRADDLQKLGIAPGPQMGQLLREAEKIAIDEDLQTTQEVIARLNC